MMASYDGGMYDDEDDDDAIEHPELSPMSRLHSTFGLPLDATQMGLDRNVPEGAWLAFAGSLSASRPSHRLVAWVLLAVFVMPLILTVKVSFF